MAQIVWVYIQSEPNLYTVGFYDPKGVWHPDSDFASRREAGERVYYLNGGCDNANEALHTIVDRLSGPLENMREKRVKAIAEAAIARLTSKSITLYNGI